MGCRQVAELVLNEMQIFNQKVTAAWAVAQKRLNLRPGIGVELASLRGFPAFALGRLPDAFFFVQSHGVHSLIIHSSK